MKKTIHLIILVICITACSVQSTETIKVNPNKNYCNNTSVKIKKIIPLETTNISLIGEINNLEFFENRIYILDKRYSKSLHIFNIDGKFVKKTIIGKGPNEYLAPRGFTINKEKKEIVIWDMNQSKFIISDLELNPLKKIFSDNLIRDFVYIGEDTILANSFEFSEKNVNHLSEYAIFCDSFQKRQNCFLHVDKELEKDWYNRLICKHKKETYFAGYWDYNIYQIKNNNITPRFFIDFEQFTIKKNDISLPYSNKIRKVEKGEIVGSLRDLAMSNKYFSFTTTYKKRKKVYFYNIMTHQLFDLDPYINKKELPRLSVAGALDNNCFIGIVSASNFRKYSSSLYIKLTHNKTDQNPFIIIFQLN